MRDCKFFLRFTSSCKSFRVINVFINNLNRCYVKNKQGKIIGLVIILFIFISFWGGGGRGGESPTGKLFIVLDHATPALVLES